MTKQYNWTLDQINQGRTVLVYRGVTARSAKHIKTADRVALVGGVMMVDGVSCDGMTMAVKPGRL